MTTPQVLFVTGPGRSGTTALTLLLNAHPHICLGVERYKFRFLRHGVFSGAEFVPRRFFTFKSTDTNLVPDLAERWETLYKSLQEKYGAARIVGDKIPHLHEKFDACSQAFPDAKWIYLLRRVNAVAASWNARALNPNDKWPSGNDYRHGVRAWNEANAAIHARLDPQRVHVVCYEDFFSGNPVPYKALLRFLRVGDAAAMREKATESFRIYSEKALRKAPLKDKAQLAFIAETADLATYRKLLRASGQA